MTEHSQPELFSDDPSAAEAAGLGRAPFLEKALATLQVAGKKKSSTAFGLIGPWGSGKTSILEYLREKVIASESGWRVVAFNPWNYSDQTSLQHGFFTELLGAFEGENKNDKLRKKIASLGESVAPLTSVGAIVGVDPSAALVGISRLIGGDQSVSAARQKVENALEKRKTPVLVIMDDLDRLAPEELLLTLKLVRLIGRLPYVHYLLAYDETTLLDVLGRTGLVGKKSVSRAREYLEKVIQVRMDLPRLRPSDTLQLTNVGIAEATAGSEMSPEETTRFSKAYFDHIGARLSTPRAIKRYFGQVKLFVRSLSAEIDMSDFLILTWLRTSEPAVYTFIQRRRDELLNSTSNFKDEKLAALASEWRRDLLATGTNEEHLEKVASLLSDLFPAFHAVWSGRARMSQESKSRRLANSDYFDRYFSFGIASGDIADAIVEQGILDIHQERATSATVHMSLALIESPDLLVSKVALAVETSKLASVPLLLWLADGFEHVPTGGGLLTPQERFIALATRLLRRLPRSDLLPAIRGMSEMSELGLVLAIRALDWASSDRADEPPVDWQPLEPSAREKIGSILLDRLEPHIENGPFDFPSDLWSLIWPWSVLDENSARDFANRALASWGPLDTISRFIGTATVMGVPGAQPRLRDIDFDLVRRLVDLEEIRQQLETAIEAAPVVTMNYYERLDTPDERRAFALSLLHTEFQDVNPEETPAD